ncbi:hypothetical protein [Streptacidiphilus sp. P02-A3a]|uniref:hypothetical protein n=1 Tax=Streptacidiphilus sp. P02-A3a TaxID=2704468 RepID=UPI0015FE6B66|nr:hypothetical protein [Streptacidiphilus sp. P02-A3a]QMU71747.1 hypothetical protein GXP74_29365 [Streptacidiphilus sp. P02-A3a]
MSVPSGFAVNVDVDVVSAAATTGLPVCRASDDAASALKGEGEGEGDADEEADARGAGCGVAAAAGTVAPSTGASSAEAIPAAPARTADRRALRPCRERGILIN